MPYTKHLKLEQFVRQVDPQQLKRFVFKDLASEALVALADAGKWFDVLHQLDGRRREYIEAELSKVNDIANENGMRMLLDRLSGANVPFDTEATPHQLAFSCRLEHPEIFDHVYDRYWLEQGQTFVEYQASKAIGATITREAVDRLAQAIKEQASREAEGRGCAIRIYLDEDRSVLIIHHRGYRQLIEEVDEQDQVIPRIVRPAELSAVIYEPRTGKLKIHARKQHVQERLRTLVGELLFENRELFSDPESQEIYSLEPLKDPNFAFDVEAGDPIEGVKLTELSLRLPMETYPRVTLQTSSGVMLAVERLGLGLTTADLKDASARIQFRFTTKGRKGKRLTVRVKPPHTCTYDSGSPNAHYAEKCLRKWHIARI